MTEQEEISALISEIEQLEDELKKANDKIRKMEEVIRVARMIDGFHHSNMSVFASLLLALREELVKLDGATK